MFSPNPCLNGGTCAIDKTQSNGYACSCLSGFVGPICDFSIKCFPNPCLNGGTCLFTPCSSNFQCTCATGWIGSTRVTCKIKIILIISIIHKHKHKQKIVRYLSLKLKLLITFVMKIYFIIISRNKKATTMSYKGNSLCFLYLYSGL